jgi:DNA polymerase-4
VQDILRNSAPVFKARGFDEFELNLCGCGRWLEYEHGGPEGFAEYLRRRVRAEVGLRLSIGIGPSPLVAKLASRRAKPDGIFRLRPEEVRAFIAPLDVQAINGIGEVTAGKLRDRGINRVEQLLALPRPLLRRQFGIGMLQLVDALEGSQPLQEDGALVGELRRPVKSIGHETTFGRDQTDPQMLRDTLWELTEQACRRLRDKNLKAAHLTIKVRYSDFKTHTHGMFLDEPLDLESRAFPAVLQLFEQAHNRRLRVRLVGVRFERLSVGRKQLDLFSSPQQQREELLFSAVDSLRDKYGRRSVLVGPSAQQLRSPRRRHEGNLSGLPGLAFPEVA